MIFPHLTGKKDAQLLEQVALGNGVAFGELYEKYWSNVCSQAYQRLQDKDKAKDIAQDIFVNIWSRKENLIENFPAYLRISVRNQVIKLKAKERNIDYSFSYLHDAPSPVTQTDARVRKKEFHALYQQFVAKLPPKRQVIFRLRHHDDMETKAIAAELGISVKTVQNQLGKAVDHVKSGLQRFL